MVNGFLRNKMNERQKKEWLQRFKKYHEIRKIQRDTRYLLNNGRWNSFHHYECECPYCDNIVYINWKIHNKYHLQFKCSECHNTVIGIIESRSSKYDVGTITLYPHVEGIDLF
jgi:hypothetical protein